MKLRNTPTQPPGRLLGEKTDVRPLGAAPMMGARGSQPTTNLRTAGIGDARAALRPKLTPDAAPGAREGRPVPPAPGASVDPFALEADLSVRPTVVEGLPSGHAIPAGAFGKTTPDVGLFEVSASAAAGPDWKLLATLPVTCHWAAHPESLAGHVHISDELDPAIHTGNYADVARDLEPNTSDLGGRPAFSTFWNRPAVVRHEQFHALDFSDAAQHAMGEVADEVFGMLVYGEEDVLWLLDNRFSADMLEGWRAFVEGSDSEIAAFSDGAAALQTLADAIRARGDAGLYPAAPTVPTGPSGPSGPTGPTGPSKPTPASLGLVKKGAKGPVVRTIQERLNVFGATLDVDGDFGPLTKAAVKVFQHARGLDDDGIVGPLTAGALGIG